MSTKRSKMMGRPVRAGATSHVLLGYRATAAEARPVLADAEKKNQSVSDWLRDAVKRKLARNARGAG